MFPFTRESVLVHWRYAVVVHEESVDIQFQQLGSVPRLRQCQHGIFVLIFTHKSFRFLQIIQKFFKNNNFSIQSWNMQEGSWIEWSTTLISEFDFDLFYDYFFLKKQLHERTCMPLCLKIIKIPAITASFYRWQHLSYIIVHHAHYY